MKKWPALLLALCGSSFSTAAAAAADPAAATQTPIPAQAQALQTQIMRCFSPPPGATTPATVVFALSGDGTVTGEPQVTAQGTTAVDQAFAKAAARAITRCAPYKAVGTDTVTVTFAATPTPSAAVTPSTAPPAQGAAQPAKTPADLAFVIPEGLCAVRAGGGAAQAALWQTFTPPPQRGAELLVLAIDCPTLEKEEAGGRARPRRLLTVLGGASQADPPPLEAYLATLAQGFSQREPLTDRFWQSPPVAGAPVVGRDARAVYVAQRQLRKADGISVAGISGYTRVGNRPLIVNVLAMDGSDISPQARATVEAVVERLHAHPAAP